MSEPEENYADAVVLCRDGKYRMFVATTADEVMSYEGRKFTYLLLPEPEGRGFVTMRVEEFDALCGSRYLPEQSRQWEYVLAPDGMQPVKVEAKTRYGRWDWEMYK